MIKVCNLTKIYNDKKRNRCVALDDVSFTLPNKGLVFIVGKSGSGKSTLLNIIGGLDNLTKGDIIIDNKKFSKFRTNDYDKYRNSYVGFVFQDFCLLDNLTVANNVALALKLNHHNNNKLVKETLAKVDLEGYGKRYPGELSGGQKQRVAIARALIKNPKLILADEPTGNLDSKTSIQILELLKELSKDNLVLIVSHNLKDANKYADRIIELADGKIIKDVVKEEGYENKLKVSKGTLYLPHNQDLTPKEIKSIESKIKSGKINKITQLGDGFKNTEFVDETLNEGVVLKKSKMKNRHIRELAWSFLKIGKLNSTLTSFMAACVVVILGLCQSLVNFNSTKAILSAMDNGEQTTVAFTKSYLDESGTTSNKYLVEIDEEELEEISNLGYEGKYYKLYNTYCHVSSQTNYNYNETKINNLYNLKKFYPLEGLGTLVCDEEYMLKTFGVNGEVKYTNLAPTIYPDGVYITDYYADGIIELSNSTKYKSREELVGYYKPTTHTYLYINGIIDTDYEEKYNAVKQNIKNCPTSYYQSNEFLEFYEDSVYRLGVTYQINENYMTEGYKNSHITFASIDDSIFYKDNIPYPCKNLSAQAYDINVTALKVNEGGSVMTTELYNLIFGTEYTKQNVKDFVPHTVKLSDYNLALELDDKPNFEIEFTIEKLYYSTSKVLYMHSDLLNQFKGKELMAYGVYFDNISGISEIYSEIVELNYNPISPYFDSIVTITKVVKVFKTFFTLLFTVLCVAAGLILSNYGIRCIRNRTREIGIIRALGGNTHNLCGAFTLQIFVVGLITAILSYVGLYYFADISNDILLTSLMEFTDTNLVLDMEVLAFDPVIAAIDSIIIMIFTLISSIIPLVSLRRIKPMVIMRKKTE